MGASGLKRVSGWSIVICTLVHMSGLGDGRREKTVKNTNDLERETEEVPLHVIGNRKSLASVIIEDSFSHIV